MLVQVKMEPTEEFTTDELKAELKRLGQRTAGTRKDLVRAGLPQHGDVTALDSRGRRMRRGCCSDWRSGSPSARQTPHLAN